MRTFFFVAVASLAGLVSGCGTVGDCASTTMQTLTTADGGTVTCECKGACGCFYADAGRCPQ